MPFCSAVRARRPPADARTLANPPVRISASKGGRCFSSDTVPGLRSLSLAKDPLAVKGQGGRPREGTPHRILSDLLGQTNFPSDRSQTRAPEGKPAGYRRPFVRLSWAQRRPRTRFLVFSSFSHSSTYIVEGPVCTTRH